MPCVVYVPLFHQKFRDVGVRREWTP